MLQELNVRLAEKNINLSFTDDLKNYILDQAFDIQYGARPIRRFIQKYVETYIAKEIISGNVEANTDYVLDYNDGYRLFNNIN